MRTHRPLPAERQSFIRSLGFRVHGFPNELAIPSYEVQAQLQNPELETMNLDGRNLTLPPFPLWELQYFLGGVGSAGFPHPQFRKERAEDTSANGTCWTLRALKVGVAKEDSLRQKVS